MLKSFADALRLKLRALSPSENEEQPIHGPQARMDASGGVASLHLSEQLASLEEASAARAEQLDQLDRAAASLGELALPH